MHCIQNRSFMFCIYTLVNKINNKTYVGKTQDFSQRIKDHLKIAKGGKEVYPNSFSYIHAAICKYGIENFDISILVNNIDDEASAFNEEVNTIAKLRADGYFLYNLTIGGDGSVGHKMSDEGRKKISEAHLGKEPWNKGKSTSEETKIKQSQSAKLRYANTEHHLKNKTSRFKNTKRPKEFGEKISKSKTGKARSRGHNLKLAKLTNERIISIQNMIKEGFLNKEIAEKFHIHRDTVSRIKNGKRCLI